MKTSLLALKFLKNCKNLIKELSKESDNNFKWVDIKNKIWNFMFLVYFCFNLN